MSDEILNEYIQGGDILQTRTLKDYAETCILKHGKWSVWQCQLKGRQKYFELRQRTKWWQKLLLQDGVVCFSLSFEDIECKLKQMVLFPEKVDENILRSCMKLKIWLEEGTN